MQVQDMKNINPQEPQLDVPNGMTITISKAAELLGVSISTLKRRASEWGIRTFWDKRGRRYLPSDIEASKKGLLEPVVPATLTMDISSIDSFPCPHGYRFRVYRSEGETTGYLGFYCSDNIMEVMDLIRRDHGNGKYHLKLLDAENRMTGYNFTMALEFAMSREEQDDISETKNMRNMRRIFRKMNQKLEAEISKEDN